MLETGTAVREPAREVPARVQVRAYIREKKIGRKTIQWTTVDAYTRRRPTRGRLS
jgi:hypothetical protein